MTTLIKVLNNWNPRKEEIEYSIQFKKENNIMEISNNELIRALYELNLAKKKSKILKNKYSKYIYYYGGDILAKSIGYSMIISLILCILGLTIFSLTTIYMTIIYITVSFVILSLILYGIYYLKYRDIID